MGMVLSIPGNPFSPAGDRLKTYVYGRGVVSGLCGPFSGYVMDVDNCTSGSVRIFFTPP